VQLCWVMRRGPTGSAVDLGVTVWGRGVGRRRASQAIASSPRLVHGMDRKLKAKNELPARKLDWTPELWRLESKR
jgi:hypothetical protein